MNKKVKYTFGGANQDIGKDKHPPHFYYEGQHIRIIATDGQTTGDVSNEKGTTVVVTLPKIEIVGVVNPPVEAIDNFATVLEFEAVNVPVLYNDVYLYDITVTIESTPTYGTVVLNDDNTITYTSENDYTVAAKDTFTYSITDGVTSSTATVTITIKDEIVVVIPDYPPVDDNFDGIYYHYMFSPCNTSKPLIHVKTKEKQVVDGYYIYTIVGHVGIGLEGKIAYRTTDFSNTIYILGEIDGVNCPTETIENPKDFSDPERPIDYLGDNLLQI